MIRRFTIFSLALTTLFALQFADCMSPMSADEQTMECCGSMPCKPASQSHDCCKTMVSANGLKALPHQRIVLSAPVVEAVAHFSVPDVPVFLQVSRLRFEAPQHSPPELYALHSC